MKCILIFGLFFSLEALAMSFHLSINHTSSQGRSESTKNVVQDGNSNIELKNSAYQCGVEKRKHKLFVTCRNAVSNDIGAVGGFFCEPSQKKRELGGISVLGKNELIRFAVSCQ